MPLAFILARLSRTSAAGKLNMSCSALSAMLSADLMDMNMWYVVMQ